MNSFKGHDGLDLHTFEWPLAQARGTVLLVHGLGEHAGRYAHVAARLNAAGWRVVAYDQRGHGASPGPRGALPLPESLLLDLARAIDALRDTGPLVLLGHSMGGALAARFVAEALSSAPALWQRDVDMLVLSSPALAVTMSAAQRMLLNFGLRFAPNLAAGNGLKPAWLSHDPAVVAAYQADPLVHNRITPRLARFIIDAGAHARALAPHWKTPTLLMWAGADRCVAPGGSAEFAAAAPREWLRVRAWHGLFHEIFNEPERDAVLTALCRGLDALLPR